MILLQLVVETRKASPKSLVINGDEAMVSRKEPIIDSAGEEYLSVADPNDVGALYAKLMQASNIVWSCYLKSLMRAGQITETEFFRNLAAIPTTLRVMKEKKER